MCSSLNYEAEAALDRGADKVVLAGKGRGADKAVVDREAVINPALARVETVFAQPVARKFPT